MSNPVLRLLTEEEYLSTEELSWTLATDTDSDYFVIFGHQWKPVTALTWSHCPSSQRHCTASVS